jgi:hypothetical protein
MRRLLTVIAHMICFCVGAALPAGGAVDALARIIPEPMRSTALSEDGGVPGQRGQLHPAASTQAEVKCGLP